MTNQETFTKAEYMKYWTKYFKQTGPMSAAEAKDSAEAMWQIDAYEERNLVKVGRRWSSDMVQVKD